MTKIFKIVLAICAAAALVFAFVAPRADAGAIDYTIGKVGSVLPTDSTGSQLAQVGAMSDGLSTQLLKGGSATNMALGSESNAGLVVTVAATIGVNNTPAVNTLATATVTAAAGVRHVAAHCSGSINAVAAQPGLALNLRDGATGAGTIVWSQTVSCPIASPCVLDSGPISILGSVNTALTCEWAGIPAVGNFEVANLEYKNAG